MTRLGKSAALAASVVSALTILWGAVPALGLPLPPDSSQWKTHGSVPDVPKYTIGVPAYFVPGNVVGSLVSPHAGQLTGTTTSTVYRNPVTGLLAFDYVLAADPGNTRFIVRATLDGPWQGVLITDTGADISGLSGTGDPSPEWTTGDPVFITRDRFTEAPAWQFRMAVGGAQIGTVIGPGNTSAHVWFETNVREFTADNIAFSDAGAIGQARALVPVPEPATFGLLAVGAFLVLYRRRARD